MIRMLVTSTEEPTGMTAGRLVGGTDEIGFGSGVPSHILQKNLP